MSAKDYARRPELKDNKTPFIKWVKRPTFEALNRIAERAHSEFKKPYQGEPFWPMESWADYPWPQFHPFLPTPPMTEPDQGDWGPGAPVVSKACLPMCYGTPTEIPAFESKWVKFHGYCPSIFKVTARMTGPEKDEYTIGGQPTEFDMDNDHNVWGVWVTASQDADGYAYVEFTIRYYGFTVGPDGRVEDKNDINEIILKCQVTTDCCKAPAYEFEYDNDTTADTIDREDSITIYVTGGCPPFSWAESGTDFDLTSGSTTARENTLDAGASACGTCTITVTDACGTEVTGYVRCTTGAWINGTSGCGLTGHGTETDLGGGISSWEYIEGNMRQIQNTKWNGTWNYENCSDPGHDCEAYCEGIECEPCIDWNTTYGAYQTPCINEPTQDLPNRSSCYEGYNFNYYTWGCEE